MDGGSVSTHGQKNVYTRSRWFPPAVLSASRAAAAPTSTSTRCPWPKCPARACCWPSRRSRTVTTRAW
eukprot:scaffold40934_cov60-Phaeocystis_antarctica.AAC.3